MKNFSHKKYIFWGFFIRENYISFIKLYTYKLKYSFNSIGQKNSILQLAKI